MARIDRRSEKTRRALGQALMSLIVRKGYDVISVQDILDEADVGRSTFYAHFTGKDDLFRKGFARLREDLRRSIATPPPPDDSGAATPLRFSRAMFEHALDYADVFRALLGARGGLLAMQEIRAALADIIAQDYHALPWLADIPKDLAIRHVTESFITALSWWLERKPDITPEEVDKLFRQLVLPERRAQESPPGRSRT